MKVLVAEDDDAARGSLETLLTAWGYAVTSVADGAHAWAVLQEDDAPRLALLDWTMPGLEGLEVCRRAREHLAPQSPYLILLTARTADEDVVAGLEGGADDYVTKPVNPSQLRARLRAGWRVVELQASLQNRVRQLEEALASVKQLQGLLPICMYCKKVRDDQNYWQQVEQYISAHCGARFSHGICPECYEAVVKKQLDRIKKTIP